MEDSGMSIIALAEALRDRIRSSTESLDPPFSLSLNRTYDGNSQLLSYRLEGVFAGEPTFIRRRRILQAFRATKRTVESGVVLEVKGDEVELWHGQQQAEVYSGRQNLVDNRFAVTLEVTATVEVRCPVVESSLDHARTETCILLLHDPERVTKNRRIRYSEL